MSWGRRVNSKPEATGRHPTVRPLQGNDKPETSRRLTTRIGVQKVNPQIQLLETSQVTRLVVTRATTFKAELGLQSGSLS